ncbi:hypothetical protein HHE02_11410 [Helicobacter heilmannii]|uniref:Uncharacterized protein n=1 Tax=Helicobacter heilmannii TaxID=35817 RepID=A0A0K2XSQ9_HELHE|nr:hypothetical protein BN341_3720 [Helicobacter heilmannii ASB1.4]CRF47845.1 hypothetical protein HHE02_11410 [Helicobacter heilmannii]CRF49019.1 hypothetical protein HHE03_06150 [Helicobacter heilmannii]CRF51495.1 hypothetical protein HHE06_13790 [Helicobacter heilmannii]CRI34115.1 hypothetical protein HHE01_09610 [Helicobacter heilmannii]
MADISKMVSNHNATIHLPNEKEVVSCIAYFGRGNFFTP